MIHTNIMHANIKQNDCLQVQNRTRMGFEQAKLSLSLYGLCYVFAISNFWGILYFLDPVTFYFLSLVFAFVLHQYQLSSELVTHYIPQCIYSPRFIEVFC